MTSADFHLLEEPEPRGRPDDRLANLQLRERAELLLFQALLVHPFGDRLALVLGVELKRDQKLRLVQSLLVHGLWTLGDQQRPDPAVASDLDQFLERPETPGRLWISLVLRNEGLGLLDDEVHWASALPFGVEQLFGEVGGELRALRLAELRNVQDD